ncbi:MAG: hypothetical protein COV29_01320 [Candidatus Yanofskybacteria bacterium CG10_big_fil_rev_8_21_14_0_10_36_16]|uniref:DHHA1 domain-containing protein n=1 Tax=Candidatus Yanofskybacteria bacterium CG10_big_fil_rev_8_21_14_0_10_36_16 TaxID=1975096 RepID=A0A2J0Q888_9BACT|nr:MAG: hypothetical protein COV29_01320 [Candidatus Yanofskybacteria bacterium CG10_big_fil_rev_8_21_14_0_10_36_16]
MKNSQETFTIYMNDDFDGVSSAAVFLYFINKKYPGKYKFKYELLIYKPGYEKWWKNKKLSNPCAVFDFRYHPGADWWFDHHETSFFDNKDKKHFQETKNKKKRWEADAKSACGVVLRHLSQEFDLKFPKHIKEMTKLADLIDSFGYKTAKDSISFKNGAYALSKSFLIYITDSYGGHVAELLSEKPIDEAVKDRQVSLSIKKTESLIMDSINEAKKNSEKIGKVVYLETKNPLTRHNILYFISPSSAYSVVMTKHNNYYHIGVGYNMWSKHENKKNIAEILKKYGGGGHKGVGATEVGSRKEALQIVKNMVKILNK